MRSTRILSVCLSVCRSVRSHSVYTRVLIQRQRMRKASVQYIDIDLCVCVRVATCVYSCRVLVSEFEEYEVHGLLAFDNKNKPVSPPIVVTMCTAMFRLAP